jgi:hypothetical protein
MITVTCRKNDSAVRVVPKYDNLSDFDVTPDNPCLPNGVYGYRHLRRTSPQVEALSPLAAWLVEQLDGKTICGMMPTGHNDIRIETDITEASALRYVAGVYGLHHNHWYEDPARALESAEEQIRAYDGEKTTIKITSYLLPIIEVRQSDEQYWNQVADLIIATGGNRVTINGQSYPLPGVVGVRYTHSFSGRTVRIPHGVDIRTVEQAIIYRSRVAEIEKQETQDQISVLRDKIISLSWWRQAFADLWISAGHTGKPVLRMADFDVPQSIRDAARECGQAQHELETTYKQEA